MIRRREMMVGAVFLGVGRTLAQETRSPVESDPSSHLGKQAVTLKPFNCTIRIFDSSTGKTLEQHILPVDSPDAEHAVASTLANAASFTVKTDGHSLAKSIAFSCIKIEARS